MRGPFFPFFFFASPKPANCYSLTPLFSSRSTRQNSHPLVLAQPKLVSSISFELEQSCLALEPKRCQTQEKKNAMSEEDPPSRRPRPHRHPAPLLGALELATFRRGPFICLSGFHEVALGDAPVYDPGEL